ncbi:FAD binding domain-containing protein [Nocardia sp. NPDC059240]|uniref:FAD binding domain-containing protein n=1 Tax=Nocardia sp. NPDC059240 TaxID=3346786 RepID=UPI0036783CB0
MDLNTVFEVCDARHHRDWRAGDAWLGGGTDLFSEPRPQLRRLVDLNRMGWPPLRRTAGGGLEIAATCTIAQLIAGVDRPLFHECCRAFPAAFKIWTMATVGGNLCTSLPSGPIIALTTALDGVCLLRSPTGAERRVPVADFVIGVGRNVLRQGELLRSVTLPGAALARRTAFRQASLYGLGRSSALVVGTGDDEGTVRLTLTASTTHPFVLSFAQRPTRIELATAIEHAVPDEAWCDDIDGLPQWRRHITFRLAEEIRMELA